MKMEINIDNLSLFNLKKICRTCLAEGEMIPLYDTCIQKNCIIEMLMSCTFIQIDKSDGLPEQICTNCLKEVEQAYKFAQKCESVQQLLKNHLKNTEITNCKVEHQNKTKFKFKILKNHSEAIKQESNSTKPVMPKVKLKLTENITNNVEEHTVNIKNEIPKVEVTESQNLENNSIKNEYNIKTEELSEHVNTEKSIQSTECENSNEFNDISEEEINDNNDDDNWSEDSVLSLEKPIKLRKKRQFFLTKGPPYICQPCNITFENYSALQEHRKKLKHPKTRRKVSCSICQRELASSQLKQHMRTHTKERPYVCTYCGRGFSLHRNMKRHMMIHTGERPYKCQECDKAFIQYTSLKEHMNKHSGQTPFVCSVCGTTFKYNAMLRKHIRSKHPEQNGGQEDLFEHECPTCNRRYHTKQILRQHMLIHGEKTYLCSVCGKGFYNNAGLQTHIKVHTGHRPHACNICGKAFRQTSGLKMHVLIHTGEKPYACSICNKAFTQRNHLRYHMRTHTGEKPYSCTVCGKSFSTNGTLTVHKRTHTGETPYICSVCGKGFYDSSSMKKHKRGHGESEQIPQNN